ncbi:MAG: hypothetical protein ACRDZX_08735, partial [Acidimicrobiales bacterium]
FRPPRSGPGRRTLVVDAADHLGPAALARLVTQAGASGTKLVLVPGGTEASRGPSFACSFDQLVDQLGPGDIAPGPRGPGFSPGALGLGVGPRPLGPRALGPGVGPGRPGTGIQLVPANPAVSVVGLTVNGGLTGADAMAYLVANWRSAAATGQAPVMVAFGPPEAEWLNLAARSSLLSGSGAPFEAVLGERAYTVGDQVLALRRTGSVPGATRGTVVGVRPSSITVEWQLAPSPGRGGVPGGQRVTEVGRQEAKALGYGYAMTVPYSRALAAGAASLLVLGDPFQIGPSQGGAAPVVAGAWVTLAGPELPALGPGGQAERRRAGIAELATGWPDEQMLERAGERPLGAAARRHWAEVVVGCALERGPRREPGLPAAPERGGELALPAAPERGPGRNMPGPGTPEWVKAPVRSPGLAKHGPARWLEL